MNVEERKAVIWMVKKPDGTSILIENLTTWAGETGLLVGALYETSSKLYRRKTYKGYRVVRFYITPDKQSIINSLIEYIIGNHMNCQPGAIKKFCQLVYLNEWETKYNELKDRFIPVELSMNKVN